MLVVLFSSCDLFNLFGLLRTVVPFSLNFFTFLRLTVGHVSEILIRILPHGLSDDLV